MKRRRAVCGGLLSAAFVGLLASACCSVPPPIPEGFEIRHERATGRFIVYGDTRAALPFEFLLRKTGYSRERGEITARLLEEKPDFIVHSGDLVGRGSSEDWWEVWDRDMARLGEARITMYAAFGNHEYFWDSGEASRLFAKRFPHLGGRHWYSVRYDRLLIVILDSNFGHLRTEDRSADENAARQDSWLEETLAEAQLDASIQTVFLVAHHAPYTNSTIHSPDMTSQMRFVERAKKCPKFRAYVCGHVHNYERFLIDGIQYVVAGGGGAPKTAVNVASPKFKDEFQGPAERPFQYCLVRVEPARIVVDVMMLKDDGTWYRGDGFTLE